MKIETNYETANTIKHDRKAGLRKMANLSRDKQHARL